MSARKLAMCADLTSNLKGAQLTLNRKSEKIDKLQRIQAETTECLICLPIDLLWSAASHLLLVLPLLLLTRWEINVTLQRTERCSSASVLEVFFFPKCDSRRSMFWR